MTTPIQPEGGQPQHVDLNVPVPDMEAQNPFVASNDQLQKQNFANTKEIGKVREGAADAFQGLANIASAPAQVAGAIAGVVLGGLLGKIFGGGNPSAPAHGAAIGSLVMTGLASVALFPLTVTSLALSCVSQAIGGRTMNHEVFANANLATKKIFTSLGSNIISEKPERTGLWEEGDELSNDSDFNLPQQKVDILETYREGDTVKIFDGTIEQEITFKKIIPADKPTTLIGTNRYDDPVVLDISKITIKGVAKPTEEKASSSSMTSKEIEAFLAHTEPNQLLEITRGSTEDTQYKYLFSQYHSQSGERVLTCIDGTGNRRDIPLSDISMIKKSVG